eukprot:CAMPEP_0202916140 /NCGR_PEP_ID=MMETSP1392-20130828/67730_1 /ASSEMBLY_ACC=CAM_ASM_000868 /TAXON_ID=225041 /ORGANISM="Chlamydomonas chlamydogama, Strain SAG 11-48b" /LENGTH=118 /DNA_ID=CAMNT_0049608449 /DNA_START=1068 /DNA_END=1423 /DNA_ORIENTATION=-
MMLPTTSSSSTRSPDRDQRASTSCLLPSRCRPEDSCWVAHRSSGPARDSSSSASEQALPEAACCMAMPMHMGGVRPKKSHCAACIKAIATRGVCLAKQLLLEAVSNGCKGRPAGVLHA